MRSFLAGLAILLFLSSGAMAQVTGFVESVGIGNQIRPDCWNPLRVNLTSTVSDPMQYQLQVWQEDLDKDKVVYTREITLSPKAQEKFDLYFLPQPSKVLEPKPRLRPASLQKRLRVKVCLPPAEGKKPDDATPVTKDWLPVTFQVDNIDPARSGFDWKKPGTRLVLYVTDGSSSPRFLEYQKTCRAGGERGPGGRASFRPGRKRVVLRRRGHGHLAERERRRPGCRRVTSARSARAIRSPGRQAGRLPAAPAAQDRGAGVIASG